MTPPPDLTQPQRLDLEEGKRLLSEKQRLEGDANALALGEADGVLEAAAGYAHAAFMVWLQDNADSLIAAAEDAEKLREMGCAATAWHQRRFPTATQERVALKLAEEAGEVCGAVIAATSGNEHPERAEKVGPEAADTLIVLLVLLGRWHPEIDLIGEVAAKLRRLNAALTPPEPLKAQQETCT